MRIRNVVLFTAGVVVGGVLLSTAFAAGLVPAWDRASITPVVFVTYDPQGFFVPVDSTSLVTPTWTKKEVTPIVETTYDSLWGFVPLRSSVPAGLGPKWTTMQVKPWTEVVYNSLGQFVTKNSE